MQFRNLKPAANQIPDKPLRPISKRMRKPKELGDMYRLLMNFIIDYVEEYGFAPSIRDVTGVAHTASSSCAYRHLENLKKRGLIVREHGKPRSLSITQAGYEFAGREPSSRMPAAEHQEIQRLTLELNEAKAQLEFWKSKFSDTDSPVDLDYRRLERVAFNLCHWLEGLKSPSTTAEMLILACREAIGQQRYTKLMEGKP